MNFTQTKIVQSRYFSAIKIAYFSHLCPPASTIYIRNKQKYDDEVSQNGPTKTCCLCWSSSRQQSPFEYAVLWNMRESLCNAENAWSNSRRKKKYWIRIFVWCHCTHSTQFLHTNSSPMTEIEIIKLVFGAVRFACVCKKLMRIELCWNWSSRAASKRKKKNGRKEMAARLFHRDYANILPACSKWWIQIDVHDLCCCCLRKIKYWNENSTQIVYCTTCTCTMYIIK